MKHLNYILFIVLLFGLIVPNQVSAQIETSESYKLDNPISVSYLKKKGLKRIDIRYPAWVAEENKIAIKVRLEGL